MALALEAIRERKTVAQIASQYKTGATNVTKWKQVAVARLEELFKSARAPDQDKLIDSLYEQTPRSSMARMAHIFSLRRER